MDDAVAEGLSRLAPRLDPAATGVSELCRLAGGASQQIWRFRLDGPGTRLILRRSPGARGGSRAPAAAQEAAVMVRAAAAGAPVPRVLCTLSPEDGLGDAYVMAYVEGQALPKRILHTDAFAPARARAADDLGAALARIHEADTEGLVLRSFTPAEAVADLARRHAATAEVRPVFSLALRHLADTAPAPERAHLVHGDFRLGNLMFDSEGLAAALDWEMAFLGDRHADFGWLCMESWRFGSELPAAGLATREALFQAYEAAGGAAVDVVRAAWWEIWAALCWGIITTEMGGWIRAGDDVSVERHVIARRASETELTLLAKLTGRAD